MVTLGDGRVETRIKLKSERMVMPLTKTRNQECREEANQCVQYGKFQGLVRHIWIGTAGGTVSVQLKESHRVHKILSFSRIIFETVRGC